MIENNKKPNFFGGYRILGYLNEKPLIAKYILDKNGFEFGFNQEILDTEYAGKFNNEFINGDLEIFCNSRISVPLQYNSAFKAELLPKRTSGTTTPSTIAWIASLIEVGNINSELTKVNKKISKYYLLKVANAVFTSDVGYVSDINESIDVWKALKIFNIKDNKLVNDFRLDNMIQSHLYKQFNNQIKEIKNIHSTENTNLFQIAA